MQAAVSAAERGDHALVLCTPGSLDDGEWRFVSRRAAGSMGAALAAGAAPSSGTATLPSSQALRRIGIKYVAGGRTLLELASQLAALPPAQRRPRVVVLLESEWLGVDDAPHAETAFAAAHAALAHGCAPIRLPDDAADDAGFRAAAVAAIAGCRLTECQSKQLPLSPRKRPRQDGSSSSAAEAATAGREIALTAKRRRPAEGFPERATPGSEAAAPDCSGEGPSDGTHTGADVGAGEALAMAAAIAATDPGPRCGEESVDDDSLDAPWSASLVVTVAASNRESESRSLRAARRVCDCAVAVSVGQRKRPELVGLTQTSSAGRPGRQFRVKATDSGGGSAFAHLEVLGDCCVAEPGAADAEDAGGEGSCGAPQCGDSLHDSRRA